MTVVDVVPRSGIRRIAVIGAGPVGLVTTRYLVAEGCFEKIDVYEQRLSVGGLWNYTPPEPASRISIPQVNPSQHLPQPLQSLPSPGIQWPQFASPMYENLETNIPIHLMQFSDRSFPPGTQVFPTRHQLMQYLKEYASDVLHLIKFGTQVSEIQAQSLGNNTWMLKSENLLTGERKECIYDAIVVCSGHYDVCYIPAYAGIREWDEAFPNRISHSKTYRSADAFHGKKILVVGSGPSSSDIASQISTRAKYPVLSSQRSESVIDATVGAQNHGLVRPMGQIAEFIHPSHGDRAVRFVSGHVESGIDSVMFATGYLYTFPFLKSTALDLIDDGMRVKHLYQHMFHINHPSLIFAGLPIKISVFSLAEAQAPVIARVLSGRLKLPSKELMSEWERATLAENGEGRAYMSMSHLKEYLYQRMLCDWANEASPSGGKLPHKWSIREAWIRERLPIMSRAFKERGDERHKVMTIEDLGFDFDKYQSEKGNLYSKL